VVQRSGFLGKGRKAGTPGESLRKKKVSHKQKKWDANPRKYEVVKRGGEGQSCEKLRKRSGVEQKGPRRGGTKSRKTEHETHK